MERRRLLVEDARGADRHLRVTWHPEAGQFNVSTWHRDVCSGAVRVDAADAARLITLLADGMADAVATGQQQPAGQPGRTIGTRPRWRTWLERGLRHLRHPAA